MTEASNRLGLTALLLAGMWLAGAVVRHVSMAMPGERPAVPLLVFFVDSVAGVVVIASLALFFDTRRRRRDPQLVLDLGLAYQVLTALALSVVINAEPMPPHASVAPMISPIGPLMLVFAAMVPNKPWRTLAAGLVSASMNPLSMLVAQSRGHWDFGPPHAAFLMHTPDYIIALLSAVVSAVVTRLGEQIFKAREMGSYRLGELIARGGMGEVYRARHALLARTAAIKLIRPEMIRGSDRDSGSMAIKRFRREAEVAASLRSPHTVALYDFGLTHDGTCYLVMELLDGVDLEMLVRLTGPLPPARVACILRQVCASLAEAHAVGLIHRDIKPGNIHLGRVGLDDDFVKVLDFGLAKSADDNDVTRRSLGGLVPGTPAYMAPEIAMGEPPDARADIYALGCVAYFLLTAQLPFGEGSGLAMLLRRVHEDAVPPSRRLGRPIAPALERLVMSCLERQPAARPTAAALSRSLAALPGEQWRNEMATEWWEEHRPLIERAQQARQRQEVTPSANHSDSRDCASGQRAEGLMHVGDELRWPVG